jgi:uncharacterized iron-regulated membrane protein
MKKIFVLLLAALFLAGTGMALAKVDEAGAGKAKKQQNCWPVKHTQASKKGQKKPNTTGKVPKPALNPQPMPPGAKAGPDMGGKQAQ